MAGQSISTILLFCFTFLCIVFVLVSGFRHVPHEPFEVFWNTGETCEERYNITFDMAQYGAIVNTAPWRQAFRGEKIFLAGTEMGLFPTIKSDGTNVNGGIPQVSNTLTITNLNFHGPKKRTFSCTKTKNQYHPTNSLIKATFPVRCKTFLNFSQ